MSNKTYIIPRHCVANAYSDWKNGLSRKIGVDRAVLFLEYINQRLNLLGSANETFPLPNNKSTWSDWRKNDGKIVVLSHDHCRVIRQLSGHDITPDQSLREEYDNTSVVSLVTCPDAQIMSNSPNDISQEYFQVKRRAYCISNE